MQTLSSKVTSKGQIVIPKKIREKYGIRPFTSIRWVEKEEGQTSADLAYARIKAFPLTFVDWIDEEHLLEPASLKARYPIS